MTALTLRRIPATVEKAIRQRAAREHVSLNKAVVGILEETVMGNAKPQTRRFHDLDWMCGLWSKKQSSEFLKNLDTIRKTDPELWQ